MKLCCSNTDHPFSDPVMISRDGAILDPAGKPIPVRVASEDGQICSLGPDVSIASGEINPAQLWTPEPFLQVAKLSAGWAGELRHLVKLQHRAI